MVLEMELGMNESAANSTGWRGTNQGPQLKSTYGWYGNTNGTDDFGFSAHLSGRRFPNGSFSAAGDGGFWWSSSPDVEVAWSRHLNFSNPGVYRLGCDPQGRFSVRCVRDDE